jgi:hypothetical protein
VFTVLPAAEIHQFILSQALIHASFPCQLVSMHPYNSFHMFGSAALVMRKKGRLHLKLISSCSSVRLSKHVRIMLPTSLLCGRQPKLITRPLFVRLPLMNFMMCAAQQGLAQVWMG